MRRTDRRRLWIAVAATAAAVGTALALAGESRGIALYAYVLLLAAVTGRILFNRIARTLPSTPPLERLLPRQAAPETRVRQLEELVHRLCDGAPNAFDMHQRLRPLVREIAGARLSRRHGVDLDRRPDRARALVGVRTWELVRPDREPPDDRHARGFGDTELDELVTELERI